MPILYTGNPFYNISVDGFLHCLESLYGSERVLTFLPEDGSLHLKEDLINEIFPVSDQINIKDPLKPKTWVLTEHYTKLSNMNFKKRKEKVSDVLRSLFASNKTRYPNIFASKRTRDGERIIYYFQLFFYPWNKKEPKEGLNCSFCGEKFTPSKKIHDNSLTAEYAQDIGSFPNSFPNTFWNGDPQTYLCPRCRSLFLFQHLSSFERNRFFVNTDSFRLNFILNKVLTAENKLDISDALGKVLKNIKTLGIWSLANVEIIQNDYNKGIMRKIFPERVARAIIKPNVLRLLRRTNRKKHGNSALEPALDLIESGNYEGLLLNAYKCMRDEQYNSKTLGADYAALFLELNGGEQDMSKALDGVQKNAKSIPDKVQTSIFQMRFKLVELTRINNRTEVVGLLTRIYLSHKRQIPDFLINIFSEEDDNDFKAKMYVLLGSVEKKVDEEDKKKKGGEENE